MRTAQVVFLVLAWFVYFWSHPYFKFNLFESDVFRFVWIKKMSESSDWEESEDESECSIDEEMVVEEYSEEEDIIIGDDNEETVGESQLNVYTSKSGKQ